MTKLDTLFDRQTARGPNAAAEAATLLATWQRLATSHLPISLGCSCGTIGHVRAQDFEQDVLDYLADKYAEAADETALLQRHVGPQNSRDGGISVLLQALANEDSSTEASRRLLLDLKRSISSWSNAGLVASRAG